MPARIEQNEPNPGAQRISLDALRRWESLGYGMFIHFGMSTFDGDEFSRGDKPSPTYAPTVDEADWRGELAIPWKALNNDPAKGRPVMLRFNFVQHKTLTGESASWAGPIDTGRDENFTGVLLIREPNTPGMAGS